MFAFFFNEKAVNFQNGSHGTQNLSLSYSGADEKQNYYFG